MKRNLLCFGALAMFTLIVSANHADVHNCHRYYEQGLTAQFARHFKAKPQKKPIFVLIGGFQGAGKSSLIKGLHEVYEANVISTDAIRRSLMNIKSFDFSLLSASVATISKNLTRIVLELGTNVFIDANAHAQRIKESKALLSEKFPHYTVIKIFLKASESTLKTRIEKRQPRQGYYQGTVEDLAASLSKTQIYPEDYDLVLDTDQLNEKEVLEAVKTFVNRYFSKQSL